VPVIDGPANRRERGLELDARIAVGDEPLDVARVIGLEEAAQELDVLGHIPPEVWWAEYPSHAESPRLRSAHLSLGSLLLCATSGSA
jgi:hypothetical protein